MDELQIERDGDTFIVRMSASMFANFAYMLLEKAKPESDGNGEAKRKGGRPRKEQPILTEANQ